MELQDMLRPLRGEAFKLAESYSAIGDTLGSIVDLFQKVDRDGLEDEQSIGDALDQLKRASERGINRDPEMNHPCINLVHKLGQATQLLFNKLHGDARNSNLGANLNMLGQIKTEDYDNAPIADTYSPLGNQDEPPLPRPNESPLFNDSSSYETKEELAIDEEEYGGQASGLSLPDNGAGPSKKQKVDPTKMGLHGLDTKRSAMTGGLSDVSMDDQPGPSHRNQLDLSQIMGLHGLDVKPSAVTGQVRPPVQPLVQSKAQKEAALDRVLGGNGPFKCPVPTCTVTKKFATARALKSHYIIHTGLKCSICGQAVRHDNFAKHFRVNHPGEVPRHENQKNPPVLTVKKEQRNDDVPEQKVFSAAKVASIKRKNGSRYPFKCAHCYSTITNKYHEDYHENKHSANSERFNCGHCDFKTVIKSSYINHLKNIHGVGPYQCQSCSQSFFAHKEWVKHAFDAHKIKI